MATDNGDTEKMAKALARPTRDAEHMDKNVILNPLAGWTTGTLPENAVMLVLEYLTGPQPITAHMLRLAMTRTQCSELSKALDHLARAPHMEPPLKPS